MTTPLGDLLERARGRLGFACADAETREHPRASLPEEAFLFLGEVLHLVSVAGTSLNQTGRAIECLTIVIAVYLLLSLAAAAVSHRLEARSLRSAQR